MSYETQNGLSGKVLLTISMNGRVVLHETVNASDVDRIVARFEATTIR